MKRVFRTYRNVLAIDAGSRNFAYAMVDSENWRSAGVFPWERVDLWAPKAGRRKKPTKQDMIDITVDWLKRNDELVQQADLVVLEQQIRVPYIVQNAVINTYCYDKCRQVSPMTVAAAFQLPKTRAEKKEAAVRTTEDFLRAPLLGEKVDDLADAYLLALWGLVEVGGVSPLDVFLNPKRAKK